MPAFVTLPVVALLMIAEFTCDEVAEGLPWRYSAATPATCGEAIDVPFHPPWKHVSQLLTVDVMLTPGANTSRHVPQLENEARASVELVAPTVSAFGVLRRRVVARVRVAVSGGKCVRHAVGDRVGDGGVERRAEAATAEAHVRDRKLTGGVVSSHPVDAGDDLRVRAAALAVEDADGDERDALRDAVRRRADRAADVRSVPVAVAGVRIVVDEVEAADGAPAVVNVRQAHAGVEDVRLHPGAR